MIRRFFQSFWAMFYKEMVVVRRNPILIRTLVILQLVDIFSFGWLDLTVHDLPVAVVDQDQTAESRELMARLGATSTFVVKYKTTSIEQARSHIRAGRAKAAVVIPPDYGRLRSSGRGAQFLTIVDGSDASTSAQVTTAIDALAVDMGVRAATENGHAGADETTPVVEAHASLLFNPSGSTALFMLPGLLALTLSSSFATRALSVTVEREAGTLERLLMTPMSNYGLLFGVITPHALLAIGDGLLYLVVMRFGFGVPIRGSVLWLLVGMVLFIFAFLFLYAVIAAGAKTFQDAASLLLYVNLPVFLLSGLVFPLSSVPKVLLPISYALPETHFIEIMRGICLRGSTATELAPHFLYLAVTAIAFIIIAERRFARSIVEE